MESFEQKPERIKAAAIRVADEVYTGESHTDAMDAAGEILGSNWINQYLNSGIEDGFITDTGRFVDRGEAADIARKNNQTNRPYREGDALDSNHLN